MFLIRFDLALSTDRINGIYPVTMMIEYTSGGQPMTQSLTSYVQITDGRSGEETEAVPPDGGGDKTNLRAESDFVKV